LFTTRQCLNKGFTRANVDKVFSRLVKEGVLIRKVPGLFVDADTARSTYSVAEIATLKASSFGKKIHQHTADSAAEIGLAVEKNDQDTYIVGGCSSRFRLVETGKYVNLRTACAKKMHLEDDNVGKVVRGLWHIGADYIRLKMIADVVLKLSRSECRKIVSAGAWMPYWLMDGFLEIFGLRYSRPLP